MTFNQLYPLAKPSDSHEYSGDLMIRVEKVGRCCQCKQLTLWTSGSFYTYICSPKCSDKLWDEYWDEYWKANHPFTRFKVSVRKMLRFFCKGT